MRELINREKLKDRSVEIGHVKSWVFNDVDISLKMTPFLFNSNMRLPQTLRIIK